MDFYHGHKERKALRQEARHERKEAKLHGKAVKAASHGNAVKASRLETKANNAHHRAEEARHRAESHHASIKNPGRAHCCVTKWRPCCGKRITVVNHADSVPEKYPTGPIPAPGIVPPPQQQPVVYAYPQTGYPNPPAQIPAYPYPAEPPPAYSGCPTEGDYPYPTK